MTSPLPVEALDHVALTVSDPVRSMKWYQDVLGFKPASMEGLRQGPPFLLRVAEGNYLNLFPSDEVPMKSVPDHRNRAINRSPNGKKLTMKAELLDAASGDG